MFPQLRYFRASSLPASRTAGSLLTTMQLPVAYLQSHRLKRHLVKSHLRSLDQAKKTYLSHSVLNLADMPQTNLSLPPTLEG